MTIISEPFNNSHFSSSKQSVFFRKEPRLSFAGIAALFLSLSVGCQDSGKAGNHLSKGGEAYRARSGRLEIKDLSARELMLTFDRAGMVDVDQLPGQYSLKAANLTCERSVGPKAKPRCALHLYDGRTLNPAANDHERMYRILLKAGGLQATSEPDRIFVSAEDLVCTVSQNKVKRDDDDPVCFLSVNPPHAYSIGGA